MKILHSWLNEFADFGSDVDAIADDNWIENMLALYADADVIGTGGKDWPAVAAGATIFLVPIMVFTILLRKHLLRGITFGAVRK